MKPTMHCPDRDDLVRLVLGHLPPSDVADAEEHLAACTRRSQVLGTLNQSDPLIDAARGAADESLAEAQRRAEPYVSRLKRLVEGGPRRRPPASTRRSPSIALGPRTTISSCHRRPTTKRADWGRSSSARPSARAAWAWSSSPTIPVWDARWR